MHNDQQLDRALASAVRNLDRKIDELEAQANHSRAEARQTSTETVNGVSFVAGCYEAAHAYRQAASMLAPVARDLVAALQYEAGYQRAVADPEEHDDDLDRGPSFGRLPMVSPLEQSLTHESVWARPGQPVRISIAPGRVLTFVSVVEDNGDIRLSLLDDDHRKAVAADAARDASEFYSAAILRDIAREVTADRDGSLSADETLAAVKAAMVESRSAREAMVMLRSDVNIDPEHANSHKQVAILIREKLMQLATKVQNVERVDKAIEQLADDLRDADGVQSPLEAITVARGEMAYDRAEVAAQGVRLAQYAQAVTDMGLVLSVPDPAWPDRGEKPHLKSIN